jgi:hypothetical protein
MCKLGSLEPDGGSGQLLGFRTAGGRHPLFTLHWLSCSHGGGRATSSWILGLPLKGHQHVLERSPPLCGRSLLVGNATVVVADMPTCNFNPPQHMSKPAKRAIS